MRLLGSKTEARRTMLAAGVPVIPGSGPLVDADQARLEADRMGYPVMVKAAAGGGGKGMRQVERPEDLEAAFAAARAEAVAAFGDATVYLEKVIVRPAPRGVPGPGRSPRQRRAPGRAGVLACSAATRSSSRSRPAPCSHPNCGRAWAGWRCGPHWQPGMRTRGRSSSCWTIGGGFYFLEVNARLQVEHPVTELVTGLDLVKAQLRLAAGDVLGFRQEDVVFRGAAIECRICAEDPFADFLPSIGQVSDLVEAGRTRGAAWRARLERGQQITPYYDPLVAKLITWGADRPRPSPACGGHCRSTVS